MKYILITLLSFTFATQITTREFSVQIDSETESIDVSNYLDLVSGYYTVSLINLNFINSDFDYWGMEAKGLMGSPSISLESDDGDNNGDILRFNHSSTSISFDNPIIYGQDNGNHDEGLVTFPLIWGSNNELELIFRVSGVFTDESNNMGDMNNDGSLNVYDVLIMVGIILDGDSGDIFDVMEIIKRV